MDKNRRKSYPACCWHLILYTTDDACTMWGQVERKEERKERPSDPVTRMLFLNVSTRQDLVWRALVSELTKVFPREETLQSRANFLLRFYSISLFSYYQWVRLDGKQAGDRRRKIWHVLTEHMCVCLKIVASTNSGPLLLMRPHWRHEPELLRVCADAWERRQLGCGMWLTFRLFKLSVFT